MGTLPAASIALAPALLLALAGSAAADSDSLLTLGAGAQYGFSGGSGDRGEVADHQYGLVGRLKVLRFFGLEAVGQLDDVPATQGRRHLSPRLQVGAMLNLLPTSRFCLFVVAGTGAHTLADLFDLNGATTSLHAGPGLEVYVSDHWALGGDVRVRLPGPAHVKTQIVEEMSIEPVEEAIQIRVWQVNLTVSYYL